VIVSLFGVAYAVDRTICVQIQPNYLDAHYGFFYYDKDDFLNDNSVAQPFRGGLVTVTKAGYEQSTRLSEVDGCALFTGLDNTATYTITAWTDSRIGGHDIVLFDDDGTDGTASQRVAYAWTSFVPVNTPPTITKTVAPSGGAQAPWNEILAASFAIWRRDGNLSPQTYTLYNQTCPPPPGGQTAGQCVHVDPTTGFTAAYLGNNAGKVNIVHEMGRYVLYRKLGYGTNNGTNTNYGECHGLVDAFGNPLASHEFQMKEYQAEAFWEGFATFYAALVFNNTTQNPSTVNCQGNAPWKDASGVAMDATTHDNRVDGFDYFDDAVNTLGCDYGPDSDGVQVNRATELDYVRFLYYMIRQGLTFPQLLDVLTYSNLDLWVQDDGQQPLYNPALLLWLGAYAYDQSHSPVTTWNTVWSAGAATHGVDR
jgi:hypothetical protein